MSTASLSFSSCIAFLGSGILYLNKYFSFQIAFLCLNRLNQRFPQNQVNSGFLGPDSEELVSQFVFFRELPDVGQLCHEHRVPVLLTLLAVLLVADHRIYERGFVVLPSPCYYQTVIGPCYPPLSLIVGFKV